MVREKYQSVQIKVWPVKILFLILCKEKMCGIRIRLVLLFTGGVRILANEMPDPVFYGPPPFDELMEGGVIGGGDWRLTILPDTSWKEVPGKEIPPSEGRAPKS